MGVIGGMLAATFIATFFIPMFYRLIAWRSSKTEALVGGVQQPTPAE
jgi:multidrug efflux pump